METKLTINERRSMLTDAIILSYKVGNHSTQLVGRPLSYYDFNKVFELIVELNKENIEQGGDDFFEYSEGNYYGFNTNN